MPDLAATRLLLVSDAPRASPTPVAAKVRRYRLARLRLEAARRAEGEPRYAHLKRAYD